MSHALTENRDALDAGIRNGTDTCDIAVGAFNTTFGERWSAASNSVVSDTFNLNVRTNIRASPFCPSDYNRGGSTTVQDVFDFLTDWFGGC